MVLPPRRPLPDSREMAQSPRTKRNFLLYLPLDTANPVFRLSLQKGASLQKDEAGKEDMVGGFFFFLKKKVIS